MGERQWIRMQGPPSQGGWSPVWERADGVRIHTGGLIGWPDGRRLYVGWGRVPGSIMRLANCEQTRHRRMITIVRLMER